MYKKKSLDELNVFPSYKGGDTCLYNGYVWEFAPRHRLCNSWGWVAQHRLVAEDKIGRPLHCDPDNPRHGEHVHHIDGCRTNNHPDNLEVMTKSAHHSLEMKKHHGERQARITEETVAAALVGRTIKQAATHLGVHHQTLRNRFPELLAPRKRRSPTRIDNPAIMEKVFALALDPNVGLAEAEQIVGASPRAILRFCEKSGVDWVHKKTRGRPSQSVLEARAQGIESAQSRHVRAHLRRERKLRDRAEMEKRDLSGAALRGFLRDPQLSSVQLESRILRPLKPASPSVHT